MIRKTSVKKLPKPQSTRFALELVPFTPGTPKWPFRTVHAHPSPLDLQYSSARVSLSAWPPGYSRSVPRLPDMTAFLTKCSRVTVVIMGLIPRTIFIFTLIFGFVFNYFFRGMLYVFHNILT